MVSTPMIKEILDCKRLGLTANQAAETVGCNYRTARKYYELGEEALTTKNNETRKRARKRDKYKELVLKYLRESSRYSSKRIYDLAKKDLNEQGLEIDVCISTFRTLVNEVRIEHKIPKKPKDRNSSTNRSYQAAPDPPPGKQAQYDFGEYELYLDREAGTKTKVYFGAVVLSYSRLHYVEFQKEPIKSKDAVRILKNSMMYFGGAPEEVVIDQDSVMVASEERGEVKLTQEFGDFVDRMPFRMRVNHKADPQSKGKIERFVGVTKESFLDEYQFESLEKLKKDGLYWLEHTANAETNRTTGEIPAERFKKEKEALLELPKESSSPIKIISQQISKDNTVTYQKNRYEVPKGSYLNGLKVKANLYCYSDHLDIYNQATGIFYASYPLAGEGVKGELFTLDNRSENKQPRVKKWKEKAMKALYFYNNADLLVKKIIEDNPDFPVEQLQFLIEVVHEFKDKKGVMAGVFDRQLFLPNICVSTVRGIIKDTVEEIGPIPQKTEDPTTYKQRWEEILKIGGCSGCPNKEPTLNFVSESEYKHYYGTTGQD